MNCGSLLPASVAESLAVDSRWRAVPRIGTVQTGQIFRDSGMPPPEIDLSTLVILLSACVCLLVIVILVALRISSRLARIERQLTPGQSRHVATESALSAAETSAGGAFEMFLSEDPVRRSLPKGEQFSAYRHWRQEKGMNWSNS